MLNRQEVLVADFASHKTLTIKSGTWLGILEHKLGSAGQEFEQTNFKSSHGRRGGEGEGGVDIPEKLVGGERGTVRGKSVFPENWRVESGEWRVESGEWRVESGEWNKFTSDLQATSLTYKPT